MDRRKPDKSSDQTIRKARKTCSLFRGDGKNDRLSHNTVRPLILKYPLLKVDQKSGLIDGRSSTVAYR